MPDFHIHVVMRTKSDIFVSACYGNEGCFSLSLLVEETKTHSTYFPKLAERRLDRGGQEGLLQEYTAGTGTGNHQN